MATAKSTKTVVRGGGTNSTKSGTKPCPRCGGTGRVKG
nr:MAG TPA: restriction alleviation protein [Caudoviricetes sp.]DAT62606.1 MAG TPA: restriction alleviation protein [Caudoviricetes sp.]